MLLVDSDHVSLIYIFESWFKKKKTKTKKTDTQL